MFRIILVVAVVALVVWGGRTQNDPYRTSLPLQVSDLTPIQAQLDKLPREDRDLVVGYLRRSNGDVLPASMADPAEPLTARTFAEAIALQRRFLAQQAIAEEQADARAEAREEASRPLRAVLSVSLVNREILPRGELVGLRSMMETAGGRSAKKAIDTKSILVTTFRIENTSNRDIRSATGNVSVRTSGGEAGDFGRSCYVTLNEPLPAGAGVDIRCGNTSQAASDEDRKYVDVSAGELVIEWEPKTIDFADGEKLVAQG